MSKQSGPREFPGAFFVGITTHEDQTMQPVIDHDPRLRQLQDIHNEQRLHVCPDGLAWKQFYDNQFQEFFGAVWDTTGRDVALLGSCSHRSQNRVAAFINRLLAETRWRRKQS